MKHRGEGSALRYRVFRYRTLLNKARRCLRRGGFLFLVGTVEDHPLVRLGRRWHPWWGGDAVKARLYAGQLVEALRTAGFEVVEAGQDGVLFWIWEVLPERIPCLDGLTPLFLALEDLLRRVARRWGAHCCCLAALGTPEGVAAEQLGGT
jgi:hypothetical protein